MKSKKSLHKTMHKPKQQTKQVLMKVRKKELKKKGIKNRSAILLLMGCLVLSTAADANGQSDITERARLANVMRELQYIQQYLEETRAAHKQDIRTRFDYDKLQRELDVIQNGIGEYVDQPRNRPKPMVSMQNITGAYQQ